MEDFDDRDEECKRIMALSDEKLLEEYLALYNGDKELAQKSLDMTRAMVEAALAKYWKQ